MRIMKDNFGTHRTVEKEKEKMKRESRLKQLRKWMIQIWFLEVPKGDCKHKIMNPVG